MESETEFEHLFDAVYEMTMQELGKHAVGVAVEMEDIVQDVMVKFLTMEEDGTISKIDDAKKYFRIVIRNQVHDAVRKQSRAIPLLEQDVQSPTDEASRRERTATGLKSALFMRLSQTEKRVASVLFQFDHVDWKIEQELNWMLLGMTKGQFATVKHRIAQKGREIDPESVPLAEHKEEWIALARTSPLWGLRDQDMEEKKNLVSLLDKVRHDEIWPGFRELTDLGMLAIREWSEFDSGKLCLAELASGGLFSDGDITVLEALESESRLAALTFLWFKTEGKMKKTCEVLLAHERSWYTVTSDLDEQSGPQLLGRCFNDVMYASSLKHLMPQWFEMRNLFLLAGILTRSFSAEVRLCFEVEGKLYTSLEMVRFTVDIVRRMRESLNFFQAEHESIESQFLPSLETELEENMSEWAKLDIKWGLVAEEDEAEFRNNAIMLPFDLMMEYGTTKLFD